MKLYKTKVVKRFNPWYVGGGVKSSSESYPLYRYTGFNPWYVGGGVKSSASISYYEAGKRVSILGMLEGVLKELAILLHENKVSMFQSLVCWRGC